MESRAPAGNSVSSPPDAAATFSPTEPPEPELGSEPGKPCPQQSSEHILYLIWSRIRLGDRRHPYLLDDVVRVPYYIGRINRFRTRLTDPSNLWVCVTLPDSASVHNISGGNLSKYLHNSQLLYPTIKRSQISRRCAVCPISPKALTANVSKAMPNMEVSSPTS